MDQSILLEGGLGALATAAIVEAIKQIGVRTKYLPLISLLVGAGLSIGWGVATSASAAQMIAYAFLFAGVASHGYDITRQAVASVSPEQEALSLERRLSLLRKNTNGSDGDAG